MNATKKNSKPEDAFLAYQSWREKMQKIKAEFINREAASRCKSVKEYLIEVETLLLEIKNRLDKLRLVRDPQAIPEGANYPQIYAADGHNAEHMLATYDHALAETNPCIQPVYVEHRNEPNCFPFMLSDMKRHESIQGPPAYIAPSLASVEQLHAMETKTYKEMGQYGIVGQPQCEDGRIMPSSYHPIPIRTDLMRHSVVFPQPVNDFQVMQPRYLTQMPFNQLHVPSQPAMHLQQFDQNLLQSHHRQAQQGHHFYITHQPIIKTISHPNMDGFVLLQANNAQPPHVRPEMSSNVVVVQHPTVVYHSNGMPLSPSIQDPSLNHYVHDNSSFQTIQKRPRHVFDQAQCSEDRPGKHSRKTL